MSAIYLVFDVSDDGRTNNLVAFMERAEAEHFVAEYNASHSEEHAADIEAVEVSTWATSTSATKGSES